MILPRYTAMSECIMRIAYSALRSILFCIEEFSVLTIPVDPSIQLASQVVHSC